MTFIGWSVILETILSFVSIFHLVPNVMSFGVDSAIEDQFLRVIRTLKTRCVEASENEQGLFLYCDG